MSKTRRNFAAAHRHIKGDDEFNSRIDRFVKKMEKRTANPYDQEREDRLGKINYKNYDQFLDDEDDIYDGNLDGDDGEDGYL